MLRKIILLLSSCALLACALPAGAAVVFSNLGPGDSYSASGYAVGAPFVEPTDFDVATAFTPTGNFALSTIELGMTHVTGGNELDIFFAADAAGAPGGVLESFHLSNAVPGVLDPQSPVLVTSLLTPLLVSGTQYWVIASSPAVPSSITWGYNTTADFGPTADRVNGGPWAVFPGDLRGAMRITGTTVAAIPEPSTYALMLAGLGLVAFAAQRRRRPHTTD